MKDSNRTITRKHEDNIELRRKWLIVQDYIDGNLSIGEIAKKFELAHATVERLISNTYKKFCNMKETNALIATQSRPDLYEKLYAEHIDTERINREFLKCLSEPDSLVLTNEELLFSEFFVNEGDEVRAIKRARLDKGLSQADKKSYNDALRIRSFYLRRKPNVANYIREIQLAQVKDLNSGKEHIQSELMAFLEKIRNNGDTKLYPSFLKTLEMLGKSIGAFEDKHIIETVNGDDALRNILSKAKEAKGNMVAYVDGVEVYD